MSKIFNALNQRISDVPESLALTLNELRTLTSEIADLPGGDAVPQTPEPRPLPNPPQGTVRMCRTLPLHIDTSAPLFPFDEQHAFASEQYRIIRTKILRHSRNPRMIVISSAGSGDGKSATAINLSAAFSLKVRSATLLVDADFRCSSVHRCLGLPQGPGLADILQGKCHLWDAVIRIKELPNLFVLTAGRAEVSPTELLDSPRWKELCGQLKNEFEHVIVDSTPVSIVADYELVQATSDGTVLVVRPDRTIKPLYKKAVASVPKEKLIGVIVNCAEEWFLWHPSRYESSYGSYLGHHKD